MRDYQPGNYRRLDVSTIAMRVVHIIAAGLVITAALHGAARACICVDSDELQMIGRADAVFFGRVVSILRIGKTEHAFVRVEEAVKGSVVGDDILVSYGVGATSCDPSPMQAGHAYDVFAKRRPNGRLTTSMCSGTRDVTRGVTQIQPGCARCDANGSTDLGGVVVALSCLGFLVRPRRSRFGTA